MSVVTKTSNYFECSVVTLKLRKEYLNTVTYNTPVLLRIKYWTVWYIECYSMSTYTGFSNFQKTVRFFGPPCTCLAWRCSNYGIGHKVERLQPLWVRLPAIVISAQVVHICPVLLSSIADIDTGQMAVIPWTRTEFGQQSCHFAAAVMWNSLPTRLRSASISCGQFSDGHKPTSSYKPTHDPLRTLLLKVYT